MKDVRAMKVSLMLHRESYVVRLVVLISRAQKKKVISYDFKVFICHW